MLNIAQVYRQACIHGLINVHQQIVKVLALRDTARQSRPFGQGIAFLGFAHEP